MVLDAVFGDATVSYALAWVGLIVAGKFALSLAQSLLVSFYAFFINKTNLRAYGPWAVVTGATDGIGKAYATEVCCVLTEASE